MRDSMEETSNRRDIQIAYNTAHGITPRTIISSVKEISIPSKKVETFEDGAMKGNVSTYIKRLELEMDVAAANLDYEKAAQIRDELITIRKNKK